MSQRYSEPEDWLDELANMNMEPENGCLGIIDDLDVPAEQLVSVTAFTDAGLSNVRGERPRADASRPAAAKPPSVREQVVTRWELLVAAGPIMGSVTGNRSQ